MRQLIRFIGNEDGATAIEYGLIAALIAVATLSAMGGVGEKLNGLFVNVKTKVAR